MLLTPASFERIDMGAGIIEGADRRQLDPPLGRHRDQALDAVLGEAGNQVVEERKRPKTDVRVLQQPGQPRGHDPERRLTIVLDAQRREHRNMEIRDRTIWDASRPGGCRPGRAPR